VFTVQVGGVAAPAADLLRLAAVPVLGWAALRDVRTRRVSNRAWYPLVAVGVLALALDAGAALDAPRFRLRALALRTALSVGIVIPLAYLLWRIGGFGGADAKALMTLAVVFPTVPTYLLPGFALPLVQPPAGVFSMTILTNTVVLGVGYPLALGARNAAAGRVSLRMFVARPVPVDRLDREYGRLIGEGVRGGLDLDALRMYLRWRDTSLDALRAAPGRQRDPASVGSTRRPGDGVVTPADDAGGSVPGADPEGGNGSTAGGADGDGSGDGDGDGDEDAWAAARFLASLDGDAYGTTPDELRAGLERIVAEETVWITPGLPFLVPTFLGLCAALTAGDLLFWGIEAVAAGPV